MTRQQVIDREWFMAKLEEGNRSVRGLARHLEIDPSAVSRMLSGQRRMKMEEATAIAHFLGAPVSEVLKHAGVSVDLDGLPTRVLLAATITAEGKVERLMEPRPLPQSVIDRAHAAIRDKGNSKVLAAQVRAHEGWLSLWDDAVVLFSHTEAVEPAAIGALAIFRTREGTLSIGKVIRARKTGEALVLMPSGKQVEAQLDTATPVIAVIP